MSVQAIGSQSLSFASDHLEQLSRGVSALTVDPFKNALYYFFPFLGAFFNNYQRIKVTDDLEAMMPKQQTERILGRFTDLTTRAKVKRDIVHYMALNHQFSSYGGSFSLTKPAILIPEHHLYRRGELSSYGSERNDENIAAHRWAFSDQEVDFLYLREVGQIEENSALLRIAIKVTVLAAFCAIYASPFGWPLGLSLFAGVLGLYIVSERIFQARADIVGAEYLSKSINNAHDIAIQTLEKVRQQNLYRREHSKIARLYITKLGNNVLDFTHPYLTTRIERLRKCARKF